MINFFEGVEQEIKKGGSSPAKIKYACDGVDFIDSVVAVLDHKGYSDSKFFICEWQGTEFLTKFSFHKKTNPEIYKSAANMLNPVDAEIAILRLLKQVIINTGISPCVLEIIYSKTCNLNLFKPAGSSDQTIAGPLVEAKKRHLELCKAGIADPRFGYIILEECDQTILRFVKTMEPRNTLDRVIFRSLFFQLLYTLRAIKHIYPGFRHYDLHSDNVMLLFTPDYNPNTPLYLQFIDFNGTTWNVPFFGMFLKIIDFGFSCIPEEKIISSISNDPVLMWLRPKSDLLYFMYDIYAASDKNPAIKGFFDTISPLYANPLEYIRNKEHEFPPEEKILRLYSDYKTGVSADSVYKVYRHE